MSNGQHSASRGLNKLIMIPEITVAISILTVVIIGTVFSDSFLTARNILNIFRNTASIGIIAIFMTMLLMSRGLDLSPDAVASLSSVMFASLIMKSGFSIGTTTLIVILVSFVIGALNSVLILLMKIPSFIVTLGMMFVGKGLATIVAGGSYILAKRNYPIYSFKLFGVTMDVIILIVIAIAVDLLLRYTVFGRKVKLIGVNSKAARISGINVNIIAATLYILTALASGFASILFTMRSGIGTTDCGTNWALQAITAAVIGGTSLYGGKGTILGTFLGVFFMGLITNIMMIFGIASEWQYVGIGVFMIFGILLNTYREKKLA